MVLFDDLEGPVPEQAEAPKRVVATSNGVGFKVLGRWSDSISCADACLKLKHAGFEFKVGELSDSLGFQMAPRRKFEIGVPITQYEGAKELLGIQSEPDEVLPDEDEIQAAMELPDHGNLSADDDVKPDWDPENWYAEDATAEVWSSDQLRPGDTIELSLRENQIHARFDKKRGQFAIFVMPEDEARAREIVRQVIGATPPE